MGISAVDMFYYIMDYSSHYYRLDSKDQLVVAADENEASVFSFVEANKRIGTGFKSKFYYMSPVNSENQNAVELEQEEEAAYSSTETNLSAVKEITDSAIADLMEEVESANCNVAQGYKMFKRLKELRLERKDKEKELECLYILTEHFDLSVMADECNNNVDALEEFLYEENDVAEEVFNSGKITNIAV